MQTSIREITVCGTLVNTSVHYVQKSEQICSTQKISTEKVRIRYQGKQEISVNDVSILLSALSGVSTTKDTVSGAV